MYGKGVDKSLIDTIHNKILGKLKPDITFIFKLNINKALRRVKKRKSKNRYDKFSKKFYEKVQKSFIKIANSNKKRYIVLDTSKDTKEIEKKIFQKVYERCK